MKIKEIIGYPNLRRFSRQVRCSLTKAHYHLLLGQPLDRMIVIMPSKELVLRMCHYHIMKGRRLEGKFRGRIGAK